MTTKEKDYDPGEVIRKNLLNQKRQYWQKIAGKKVTLGIKTSETEWGMYYQSDLKVEHINFDEEFIVLEDGRVFHFTEISTYSIRK